MNRKIQVLGIAPYEGMETIMQKLAAARNDFELTTYVGDFNKGAEIVENNPPDKYDVIISRGGTAEILHQATNIPVIEINMSVYDILRAIKLAENYADRYAIVGFSAITKSAALLCNLLRYEIDVYTVKTEEDVTNTLTALKQQGYHMVLCDMINYRLAKELGLHAILITSGEESIEEAFDQAIRLCSGYAHSRERIRILSDTLSEHSTYTVLMQADGSIYFSTCDHSDKELIYTHLEKMLKSAHIEKTKKSFQTIGSNMYVVTVSIIPFDPQPLIAFYIEPNPVPPLSSKYGLRFTDQKEIKQLLLNSLYNTSPQTLQPLLGQLNETNHPLMLEGEEGTNKAEAAYLIYTKSRQSRNPLIIVDCALLNDKNWRFLISHYNSPFCDTDNTIYINHLNELSRTRQKQMLSALIDMNVCKTNRVIFSWTYSQDEADRLSLREFVNSLACISLRLPPLRERPGEIASMASLYLNTLNMELSKQIIGFDPEALELLCGYHWPSNYIQLKRILTELAVHTETHYIKAETTAAVLKKEIAQQLPAVSAGLMPELHTPAQTVVDLHQPLNDITRAIIRRVLDDCSGNQSKAARQLGISRSTLWRYLK